MKYHYKPTKMPKIKKTDNRKCQPDVELELSDIVSGRVNGPNHFGNCLAICIKGKYTPTLWPRNASPTSIPKRNETCIRIFITQTNNGNNQMSIKSRMNKQTVVYSYYLTTNENELINVTIWMDLKYTQQKEKKKPDI